MGAYVPYRPRFVTPSEERVFDLVTAQLGDDCVVLGNVRIADDQGDHEADLVVLIPDAGIVVVEVKGSHVWVEGGQWYIKRETTQRIRPVEQMIASQYALRRYVESDPRWGSRGRVRWGHHLVLAHTALDDDFSHPALPREHVSGSGDLGSLGVRLRATMEPQTDARPPRGDDVELITEIVQGRSLPARDLLALAAEREEHAQRLSVEQATLLQVIRLLPRVEIRGGAGSGKTVLAIQQARDLASGRLTQGKKKRVAVVCYSYGLASHLERALAGGHRSASPVFVGTFEDLGRRWGITEEGDRDDPDFWETELPRLMAERAATLEWREKFDAIIVDEAQDFADDWWQPLVRALRDEETGGLYAYSDERQRVFARFGRPPVPLVPLVLDHNLRNTRQIAQTFASLAPVGMELRGGDGPEVTFVASDPAGALSVADDQVEMLLEEGWEPQDVALISTGPRHPVQKERQSSLGQKAYWAQFLDADDIFYGHVLGFKGMERRAVVLCVNEDGSRDRAAERLYVGLSRATDRLVVVADPQMVRAVGGAEVCQRLGI